MKTNFDAIVIGSGISGGWAAKELTEQGLETLVLPVFVAIKMVSILCPTENFCPPMDSTLWKIISKR